MVEVRWEDEENQPQKALALLEDISPSGACVQLENAIPWAPKFTGLPQTELRRLCALLRLPGDRLLRGSRILGRLPVVEEGL